MKQTKLVAAAAVMAMGGAVVIQAVGATRPENVTYTGLLVTDTVVTQLQDLCLQEGLDADAQAKLNCASALLQP